MPYFPWFISLVSGLFAFYIHMEVALCHLWCCGSYLFKWLTNLLLLDITNICISLDYFLDLFLFHTYSKPLDHFFSIISALTVILNIFISSLLITYPTSSFWYSIFVCTTFFVIQISIMDPWHPFDISWCILMYDLCAHVPWVMTLIIFYLYIPPSILACIPFSISTLSLYWVELNFSYTTLSCPINFSTRLLPWI